MQALATMTYLNGSFTAKALVNTISCINSVLPVIILGTLIKVNCTKRKIHPDYKFKLKKLTIAVIIWSMTRITRAGIQLWDNNLFYGYMVANKKGDKGDKVDKD